MPDAPTENDPPGALGTDGAPGANADSGTPVVPRGLALAGVLAVTILAVVVDLVAASVPSAYLGALLVGAVAFVGAVVTTWHVWRAGEPVAPLVALTVLATGAFAWAVVLGVESWYAVGA